MSWPPFLPPLPYSQVPPATYQNFSIPFSNQNPYGYPQLATNLALIQALFNQSVGSTAAIQSQPTQLLGNQPPWNQAIINQPIVPIPVQTPPPLIQSVWSPPLRKKNMSFRAYRNLHRDLKELWSSVSSEISMSKIKLARKNLMQPDIKIRNTVDNSIRSATADELCQTDAELILNNLSLVPMDQITIDASKFSTRFLYHFQIPPKYIELDMFRRDIYSFLTKTEIEEETVKEKGDILVVKTKRYKSATPFEEETLPESIKRKKADSSVIGSPSETSSLPLANTPSLSNISIQSSSSYQNPYGYPLVTDPALFQALFNQSIVQPTTQSPLNQSSLVQVQPLIAPTSMPSPVSFSQSVSPIQSNQSFQQTQADLENTKKTGSASLTSKPIVSSRTRADSIVLSRPDSSSSTTDKSQNTFGNTNITFSAYRNLHRDLKELSSIASRDNGKLAKERQAKVKMAREDFMQPDIKIRDTVDNSIRSATADELCQTDEQLLSNDLILIPMDPITIIPSKFSTKFLYRYEIPIKFIDLFEFRRFLYPYPLLKSENKTVIEKKAKRVRSPTSHKNEKLSETNKRKKEASAVSSSPSAMSSLPLASTSNLNNILMQSSSSLPSSDVTEDEFQYEEDSLEDPGEINFEDPPIIGDILKSSSADDTNTDFE